MMEGFTRIVQLIDFSQMIISYLSAWNRSVRSGLFLEEISEQNAQNLFVISEKRDFVVGSPVRLNRISCA